MNEAIRGDLHEAKGHAKEAARATLLAMRGALDFAIEKLGADPESGGGAASTNEAPGPAPATPEGSMAAPSMPDDRPAAGDPS